MEDKLIASKPTIKKAILNQIAIVDRAYHAKETKLSIKREENILYTLRKLHDNL